MSGRYINYRNIRKLVAELHEYHENKDIPGRVGVRITLTTGVVLFVKGKTLKQVTELLGYEGYA